MSNKPITLYGHGNCIFPIQENVTDVSATGPNPWKVAIILEELKIPYETKYMGKLPSCLRSPFIH